MGKPGDPTSEDDLKEPGIYQGQSNIPTRIDLPPYCQKDKTLSYALIQQMHRFIHRMKYGETCLTADMTSKATSASIHTWRTYTRFCQSDYIHDISIQWRLILVMGRHILLQFITECHSWSDWRNSNNVPLPSLTCLRQHHKHRGSIDPVGREPTLVIGSIPTIVAAHNELLTLETWILHQLTKWHHCPVDHSYNTRVLGYQTENWRPLIPCHATNILIHTMIWEMLQSPPTSMMQLDSMWSKFAEHVQK